MARMRLLKDLYPYIKEKDPGTAFTPNSVRRLALSGVFPFNQIESRRWYNLDKIDELLDDPEMLQERIDKSKQQEEHGKIRKIS